MKDNMDETVRNNATTEVNSSTRLFSVLSERCNEVMTNRQNPSRLADVLKICCEVLLAIEKIYFLLEQIYSAGLSESNIVRLHVSISP